MILIILANVSLLNLGPEKLEALNCFFQNVQGFVTLNSISKPFPDLCITKILEFQAHVFENAPDIIILNETWLKPSISTIEIFTGKSYKIFRVDRSPESHPPDLDNPKKFKRNGGVCLLQLETL